MLLTYEQCLSRGLLPQKVVTQTISQVNQTTFKIQRYCNKTMEFLYIKFVNNIDRNFTFF